MPFSTQTQNFKAQKGGGKPQKLSISCFGISELSLLRAKRNLQVSRHFLLLFLISSCSYFLFCLSIAWRLISESWLLLLLVSSFFTLIFPPPLDWPINSLICVPLSKCDRYKMSPAKDRYNYEGSRLTFRRCSVRFLSGVPVILNSSFRDFS